MAKAWDPGYQVCWAPINDAPSCGPQTSPDQEAAGQADLGAVMSVLQAEIHSLIATAM
jgi:hypothetical protein